MLGRVADRFAQVTRKEAPRSSPQAWPKESPRWAAIELWGCRDHRCSTDSPTYPDDAVSPTTGTPTKRNNDRSPPEPGGRGVHDPVPGHLALVHLQGLYGDDQEGKLSARRRSSRAVMPRVEVRFVQGVEGRPGSRRRCPRAHET